MELGVTSGTTMDNIILVKQVSNLHFQIASIFEIDPDRSLLIVPIL